MRNAVVKFIGINVPLFIKLLYTAHAPEMPLPIFLLTKGLAANLGWWYPGNIREGADKLSQRGTFLI
jgi:hypothetical protein